MKSPTPGAEEYHIAWITALPIELSAATTMLDEEYASSDDTTLYTLGRVGRHNIVLVCLPAGQIGTSSTATTVAEMKSKFPALQIGLLVGIGGGVPSSNADVRLGDVVISQPQRGHGGVIQYDFGKIGPGGKHIPTGFVNAPPAILLSAITRLKSNQFLGRSSLGSHLQCLAPFPAFQRQNAGADVLFQADYEHPGGPNCDGCRKDMEIIRPSRDGHGIVLHYGIIASGNQVIRDGKTRDGLSAEFGGILCFEMEAAGLLNFLPCIVIRGICDYADSHKNKMWHPYAAGNAAACAKELLTYSWYWQGPKDARGHPCEDSG
ncbi:nucleoside phosphorylase domain-containing protein [Aspergillus falconensis]